MLDFISQNYSDGLHLPDGTVLRNLESQVQKNKEDIANHYNIDRVLADFGIRVIGQLVSSTELPDPETFTGEYGDAYAVGSEPPYRFYIWTRADADAGRYADYWMDIGYLAIVGPQGPEGPQGPQGETGERGSKWYIGTALPANISGSIDNDLYLNSSTGMVYQYRDAHWYPYQSIKGPQGVQGIRGEKGDTGEQGPQGIQGPTGRPGSIYNIVATLADVGQLPAPDDVGENEAYLVGEINAYYIYAVINDEWRNLGLITMSLPGGTNEFLAYDKFGNPIGASLYNNSVIFRNFRTDSATGLVNGALTITFFDSLPITSYSHERGYLYDYLMKYDYTSAANNYMPCSGFALETPQRYEYFGIAANPNVEGQLYFIGYRYNIETGAMKQASWGFNESTLTKYYRSHIIPPDGNL